MASSITPLHFCIFRCKDQEAIDIIEAGKADLDATDPTGITPMHMACYRDQLDIVKRLLEAGANGMKADSRGNTPLHVAAGAGSERVVKYLIEKGMRLNERNSDGRTVLKVAQDHCPLQQRSSLVRLLHTVLSCNDDGDEKRVETNPTDDKRKLCNDSDPCSERRRYGHTPTSVANSRGGQEVRPLRLTYKTLVDVIREKRLLDRRSTGGEGGRTSGAVQGLLGARGEGGDGHESTAISNKVPSQLELQEQSVSPRRFEQCKNERMWLRLQESVAQLVSQLQQTQQQLTASVATLCESVCALGKCTRDVMVTCERVFLAGAVLAVVVSVRGRLW